MRAAFEAAIADPYWVRCTDCWVCRALEQRTLRNGNGFKTAVGRKHKMRGRIYFRWARENARNCLPTRNEWVARRAEALIVRRVLDGYKAIDKGWKHEQTSTSTQP